MLAEQGGSPMRHDDITLTQSSYSRYISAL